MTCLRPSVQGSNLHKSIHICVYSYMHANIPLASNTLYTYIFQCLNTSSTCKLNVSPFSERTCAITETLSNKDRKFQHLYRLGVYYLLYLYPYNSFLHYIFRHIYFCIYMILRIFIYTYSYV